MTKNALEKRIETLIDREIFANQSHLVEELVIKPNPDWIDNIENYYDESSEAVEEFLLYETDLSENDWLDLDTHERLDLAQQKGFEAPPHEIFEWWLVSDWLAEKLKEFEEPVLDIEYGTWWGRTGSGQAIKLDNVIRMIVTELKY